MGPGCELTWNYSTNLISKTNHLTIIRHIWNLEAFGAVSLIGPELYPKPLGAGGEGDGTFVRLTRLVGRHRVGESCEERSTEERPQYVTTDEYENHSYDIKRCFSTTVLIHPALHTQTIL